MYSKFDYFERPSSAFGLFLKAIIGSFVSMYVNVRGKYFLKVLINIYCDNSLNNKQNNWFGI